MKKLVIASLLSGLSILSTNIFAATNITSNFQATSTLNSSCVISAQDVSFGELNLITTNTRNITGTINVLCSKGINYSLSPEGGYNLGGTSYQGIFQALLGTGSNKDAIIVTLEKINGTSWIRDTQGTSGPITGISTGSNQTQNFIVRYDDRGIQGINPAFTNSVNSKAQPDIYSGTLAVKITY